MKSNETPLLTETNESNQDALNDDHKNHLDFFLSNYISSHEKQEEYNDNKIKEITQLCIGPDWEETTIKEAETYIQSKLTTKKNNTLTPNVFNNADASTFKINSYIASALQSAEDIEHNEWELYEFAVETCKSSLLISSTLFYYTGLTLEATKDTPFFPIAILPALLGIGFAGLALLSPTPVLAYNIADNILYGANEITKSMKKIISTDIFNKPSRTLKHLIRTGITIGLTLGGIKGGMLAGAALGSVIPGIGTGIGAAAGAAFGGIYSLGYGAYISKTLTRKLCSSLRQIGLMSKSTLTQEEKESLQQKGFNTDIIENCIQHLRAKKKTISYKTCLKPQWSGSVAKRKINDLIKKLKNGVMPKEIIIGDKKFTLGIMQEKNLVPNTISPNKA